VSCVYKRSNWPRAESFNNKTCPLSGIASNSISKRRSSANPNSFRRGSEGFQGNWADGFKSFALQSIATRGGAPLRHIGCPKVNLGEMLRKITEFMPF
jgi:hypothetical protein